MCIRDRSQIKCTEVLHSALTIKWIQQLTAELYSRSWRTPNTNSHMKQVLNFRLLIMKTGKKINLKTGINGANYAMYPPMAKPYKPIHEWNHLFLVVDGNFVTQMLNDVVVVRYEKNCLLYTS